MNDQSAIAGRAVAKLEAGANISAIVPTTIDQTFRLAELIHQSGLAPYQLKNAAAVTVVFLKGLEIGLPPMAALECIGVINGKACLHSDGIPSLLWSRGFKINEWYESEETLDTCVAHCKITRPDGGVYVFKYSAQDAKDNRLWDTREKIQKKGKDGSTYTGDNDSPWFRYKKRMLRMRCRGWLARDCAADVLKGIPIFEEEADIQLGRDEYREVKSTSHVAADLPDIPDPPAVVVLSDAEAAKRLAPEEPLANPAAFKARLKDALALATDDASVMEIWDSDRDIVESRLSRSDRSECEGYYDDAMARVRRPVAAE
jgi:hypothetical protein